VRFHIGNDKGTASKLAHHVFSGQHDKRSHSAVRVNSGCLSTLQAVQFGHSSIIHRVHTVLTRHSQEVRLKTQSDSDDSK
jgi:hypothetical protein